MNLKKERSPVYHVFRKCYNKVIVFVVVVFSAVVFKVVIKVFKNCKLLFLKIKPKIYLFLKLP